MLGRLSTGVETLDDDGGVIVGRTGAKVVVVVAVVVVAVDGIGVGVGVAVTVGGVDVVEGTGGGVVVVAAHVSEAAAVVVVAVGSLVDVVVTVASCEVGGSADVFDVEGSGCDDGLASWCVPFFLPSSLKHFEHMLLFSGLLHGMNE